MKLFGVPYFLNERFWNLRTAICAFTYILYYKKIIKKRKKKLPGTQKSLQVRKFIQEIQ
jgi:hypothetical protein